MAVAKLDDLIALLDVPFFERGEKIQVEGLLTRPEINSAEGWILWRIMEGTRNWRYFVALKLRERSERPVMCFISGKYLKHLSMRGHRVKRREFNNQRSLSFETKRAQRLSQYLVVIPNVAVVHCSIHLQMGLLTNAQIIWEGSNNATELRQTVLEHIIEHGLALGH